MATTIVKLDWKGDPIYSGEAVITNIGPEGDKMIQMKSANIY